MVSTTVPEGRGSITIRPSVTVSMEAVFQEIVEEQARRHVSLDLPVEYLRGRHRRRSFLFLCWRCHRGTANQGYTTTSTNDASTASIRFSVQSPFRSPVKELAIRLSYLIRSTSLVVGPKGAHHDPRAVVLCLLHHRARGVRPALKTIVSLRRKAVQVCSRQPRPPRAQEYCLPAEGMLPSRRREGKWKNGSPGTRNIPWPVEGRNHGGKPSQSGILFLSGGQVNSLGEFSLLSCDFLSTCMKMHSFT